MTCKMSREGLCQYVQNQGGGAYAECEGEPQDKVECPFWSGGLEKQSFKRVKRKQPNAETAQFMKKEGY